MSEDNNDTEKNDKETFETFEQFIERLRDICRKLGLNDIQLDRINRPRQILDRLCKLLVLSDRKGLLIELRFIDINTPLEDILITEVNSEIIDKYATLKRLDSVFIFNDIKHIDDKNINVCMTEFESEHKVKNTVKHFGYLASMLGNKYDSKKYALNISYVIIYGPQINPIVDYRLNINSQKYEPNCLFLSDTDEVKFFQEKFEKVSSGQKLSPIELMRLFTLHKIGSNNIKNETLINTLDLFFENFRFLDQKTGVIFYCFLVLYLSDDLNDEQRKLFIKRGPEVFSVFENYENELKMEGRAEGRAEVWAEAEAKVHAAEVDAQAARADAQAARADAQAAIMNNQIKFVRFLKESGVSNESILKNTGLSKEELAEIENKINLQYQ